VCVCVCVCVMCERAHGSFSSREGRGGAGGGLTTFRQKTGGSYGEHVKLSSTRPTLSLAVSVASRGAVVLVFLSKNEAVLQGVSSKTVPNCRAGGSPPLDVLPQMGGRTTWSGCRGGSSCAMRGQHACVGQPPPPSPPLLLTYTAQHQSYLQSAPPTHLQIRPLRLKNDWKRLKCPRRPLDHSMQTDADKLPVTSVGQVLNHNVSVGGME
jgi:hypothetical protein